MCNVNILRSIKENVQRHKLFLFVLRHNGKNSMTGDLGSRPGAATCLLVMLSKSHKLSVLPTHKDGKELKLYL